MPPFAFLQDQLPDLTPEYVHYLEDLPCDFGMEFVGDELEFIPEHRYPYWATHDMCGPVPWFEEDSPGLRGPDLLLDYPLICFFFRWVGSVDPGPYWPLTRAPHKLMPTGEAWCD